MAATAVAAAVPGCRVAACLSPLPKSPPSKQLQRPDVHNAEAVRWRAPPPSLRPSPPHKGKRRSSTPCQASTSAPSAPTPLPSSSSQVTVDTQGDSSIAEAKRPLQDLYWEWRGHRIRYQQLGEDGDGPAIVCIHGFGGNCSHWRKNLPEFATIGRAYAIDLLGYGYSDKPSPRGAAGEQVVPNGLYNFHTWSAQVLDFCREVAGGPAFLICNSVGGIVGLLAAVDEPEMVKGVFLLNISLRMLHLQKQSWYTKPFVKALQRVLRETSVGEMFFKQVATPRTVEKILKQAYADPSTVTPELVSLILEPGLLPGAVDVFLDFVSYSGGPLPEELLAAVKRPVFIGWGEKDPWEPLALGKNFQQYKCVEEFVVLPKLGHCPMDEGPEVVNPLVKRFVLKHSGLDVVES
eukprot:jgi/Chlat1/5455/Chrsp36S05448